MQVTHTPFEVQELVLSPDGERIAFGANDPGDFEIYSTPLDGTHRRALTHGRAYEEAASWGVKRR